MIPIALLTLALLIILVIAFSRRGGLSGRTRVDFLIGFVGWFLINMLLCGWVKLIAERTGGTLFINPLGIVPLLLNIVAVLALFQTQRWMTWGIFSAIIVNAIGLFLVAPANVPYSNSPITEIIGMIPFFMPYFIPALF
jgi:hypothetical protein